MIKITKRKSLFLVFLLALLLPIYNLDNIPVGFHANEARVDWDAFSILKTSKDDRENYFPLYYNTFGDYRPTGIFYLKIPALVLIDRMVFGPKRIFSLALFVVLQETLSKSSMLRDF